RLPADAILEIDGHRTTETGDTRTFQTPPLALGGRYTYNLKATANGKEVTRQISIAHGVDNSFDLRADFRPAASEKPHPKQFTPTSQRQAAPGSPSATTTIDGRYLPNPPPKFGGVI